MVTERRPAQTVRPLTVGGQSPGGFMWIRALAFAVFDSHQPYRQFTPAAPRGSKATRSTNGPARNALPKLSSHRPCGSPHSQFRGALNPKGPLRRVTHHSLSPALAPQLQQRTRRPPDTIIQTRNKTRSSGETPKGSYGRSTKLTKNFFGSSHSICSRFTWHSVGVTEFRPPAQAFRSEPERARKYRERGNPPP